MQFKKTIINIITIFVSLICLFLLFEIIFRLFNIEPGIFSQPDPLLGVTLIPGAKYQNNSEGFSKGTINSHGLRDKEHSYSKPDNTFRIVILGDSFTEALQVDIDSAYHQHLSRLLNLTNTKKYEIIAMGRSGMGTLEELLWYQREGRKYHPDIVVCAFYIGNDFRDNSRRLSNVHKRTILKPFLNQDGSIDNSFIKTREYRFRKTITPILRFSRFFTFIMRKIELIQQSKKKQNSIPEFPLDLYILKKNYDIVWQQALETTAQILRTFNTEVQKDSAKFIVIGIPDSYQINGATPLSQYSSSPIDIDLNKPDSVLSDIATVNGFQYIPLFDCFKTAFEKTGIYYYGFGKMLGTGHWNEHGHALAAQCIDNALQKILNNN
ncbi:MAG TPA: hypothetical protein DCO75_08760 [Fibrobacteres bacterium]|jgi:hypothetical protein|nr:hypothetical protein [Fibrobacterota bacterium]